MLRIPNVLLLLFCRPYTYCVCKSVSFFVNFFNAMLQFSEKFNLFNVRAATWKRQRLYGLQLIAIGYELTLMHNRRTYLVAVRKSASNMFPSTVYYVSVDFRASNHLDHSSTMSPSLHLGFSMTAGPVGQSSIQYEVCVIARRRR